MITPGQQAAITLLGRAFSVGVFRFALVPRATLFVPAVNKANMLRGAFGHAFRRLCCVPQCTAARDCPLGESCPYKAIFEPSPLPEAERLSKNQDVPRPFIFRAPAGNKTKFEPGEEFDFGLVLIGRALDHLPYFVLAFRELAAQGLGLNRAKCELKLVEETSPLRHRPLLTTEDTKGTEGSNIGKSLTTEDAEGAEESNIRKNSSRERKNFRDSRNQNALITGDTKGTEESNIRKSLTTEDTEGAEENESRNSFGKKKNFRDSWNQNALTTEDAEENELRNSSRERKNFRDSATEDTEANQGMVKVFDSADQVFHSPAGLDLERFIMQRLDHIHANRICIRFLSPTWLKSENQVVRRPEFSHIFKRLRDRINALSTFFGTGSLDADFAGLGKRSELVRTVSCNVRWEERFRTSSKTHQRHELSGFTGEAVYEGQLEEFLPWLVLGELVHVGKHTAWGMGELQMRGNR